MIIIFNKNYYKNTLRVMPNTSNLRVPPAPPSWEKHVCRTCSEEFLPIQGKRSLSAVSLSFFQSAAGLHSFVSCDVIAGSLVCYKQQRTLSLGALTGSCKAASFCSRWVLSPSQGPQQKRPVTQ